MLSELKAVPHVHRGNPQAMKMDSIQRRAVGVAGDFPATAANAPWSAIFSTVAALTLLSLAGRAVQAAIAAPVKLQCQLRKNPLAINATRPRLGWVLPWKGRDQSQSAYEILVASSRSLLAQDQGNLWASGRVRSDDSIHVRYAGKPLSSRQRCFWKVRVWNQAGKVSRWSAIEQWQEGLLAPAAWRGAKWIGWRPPFAGASWVFVRGMNWQSAPGSNDAQASAGHFTFYKTFIMPAGRRIKSAVLKCAADNAALISINGRLISSQWGSPFNAPGQFKVRRFLQPGINRLAVLLWNQGAAPNPSELFVGLQIRFSGGKALTVATDKSWRAVAGKPQHWAASMAPRAATPVQVVRPWGGQALPAIYLRRQFTVAKPIQRAVAYLCGLGLSKLYFNGQPASHDQLSPPLSWYPKRCYYVAFNVTKLLRPGPNAVGVTLGNGRMYRMGGYTISIPPRMLFLLHLRYADGSMAVLTSNGQWQMTDRGPIRMNNEYNGETYEARLRIPGWDKVRGYGLRVAAHGWRTAALVHSPGGRLVAEFQQPIQVTRILHPVALLHAGAGQWIFDLGQNMVGWCQIRVDGPAGTTIVLRHAEALTRNGHRWMPALGPGKRLIAAEKAQPRGLGLYTANLRSAQQTDTLILSGKPMVWHPIFTYHGFRYVEVTGYPGRPTLSTLEGQEVHDGLPVTGGFACSDRLLNQIYHNCKWGIQDNYRSIPTDCPQRDERQGWMGDRSAESRGEMFFFNDERFYNKWLWDIQDGQHPNGDIADVNPPYWGVYVHDVTWPGTFIMVANNLYLQYGETTQIRRHYAAMTRWINYQLGSVHNGVDPNGGFGDWDPPPHAHSTNIGSHDPNRGTPGPLIATASLYKYLKIMARFAGLLHKPAQRRHWLAEAGRLYRGFNQSQWNAQGGYYGNGSDTSCLLPLAVGIVPPARKAAVARRLVALIRDRQQGHLYGGLIGMQWAFQALGRIHQLPLGWAWLNTSSYPSYGYMIRHGATTLWENWNGNTAGPAMNSMNHVMLIGDMLTWLFTDVGGIRADRRDPGFKHIIMRPHLMAGLRWVKCWHRSPYGLIESDWKIASGRRFDWRIRVPANSWATVYVPAASEKAVREGSVAATRGKGVKFLRMQRRRVVFRIGSGRYHFVCRTR